MTIFQLNLTITPITSSSTSYLASSGSPAARASNAVAKIGLFRSQSCFVLLLTIYGETLLNILYAGPAVLNGGLTTLIALVLLAFSTSHVFVTFFRSDRLNELCDILSLLYSFHCRVFVLTVVFGLFHGLVLLPILLVHFGPLEEPSEIPECQPSPPSSTASASTSTSIPTSPSL